MCVDGVLVFSGDERMVLVKSRFINEKLRYSIDDYGGALNVLRAWRTEGCALCEQKAYADQKSGAQKKLLNLFVLMRGESNGMDRVWVGKGLLLFQHSMEKEINGEEFALLHYKEGMLPLYKVDEALSCSCLRWANAGSAKEEHDVEVKRVDRAAVAAGEWIGDVPFQSTVRTMHVV